MTFEFLHRARNSAVRAALSAGRLIRARAGQIEAATIEDKGTHDLVTEVDVAAQRLILDLLREEHPDFDVLAEEDETTHGPVDPGSTYRWIVDPIDGTTNFAHGVPPYAVSIALQHATGIVVGVVYDVAHDELFTAVRDGGTQVNGRPASVSTTRALADSLVTTGFPYRTYDHVEAYLGVLRAFMERTRGVRRPGSASVDLAWVAAGRFDAFFETGLMPWDVAAGTLLVTEAGGTVTDYAATGDPVFDRQIVASNGEVHAEVIDILAPMRDIRL